MAVESQAAISAKQESLPQIKWAEEEREAGGEECPVDRGEGACPQKEEQAQEVQRRADLSGRRRNHKQSLV